MEEYNFVKRGEYNISSVYLENIFVGKYRIVYPKKNGNSENKAALMIAEAIRNASGIVVNVINDHEADSEGYEILVGATNRNTDDEISSMSEKLLDIEAVIERNGNNINVFGKKAIDDIKYNEHGKPYFEHGACFNISHSKNYAVLAVSGDNIGIDVEEREAPDIAVAKRCFTKEEFDFAKQSTQNFLRIWTAKEAVLKKFWFSISFFILS